MNAEYVNLTPNWVLFQPEEGEEIAIKPSGQVAHVVMTYRDLGLIGGIPVSRAVPKEIANLPEYKPGTVYIVSQNVAQAGPALGRLDLVSPDSETKLKRLLNY